MLLWHIEISTQLYFNQAQVWAALDPSACKVGPEGREFVADSHELGSLDRHTPGCGIIAFPWFLILGGDVVVLAFGSKQDLEISKKRLLG